MANERLRAAMDRNRVWVTELATYTEKDPKTVSRWLGGRVPHPRTRYLIAKRLREDEEFLWPGASRAADDPGLGVNEIVKAYPHRNLVPSELWDRLLDQASTYVDILVYVGMFMTEKPHLAATLRRKAEEGTRVRLLFGKRDSEAVIQRSLEEGIGKHTISAKIDHTMAFFRPLAEVPGTTIRVHGTTLYNSIYRFDDEMIVNPHVYGTIAAHAPALHLRHLRAGNLFTVYADSFASVWDQAEPASW
ncbi:MAG: DUF5919 domain-containing protein [Dehalococcoidia bacterium]